MPGMRNLLIGGSGFIGQPLAVALANQGEAVVSLSRTGGQLAGVQSFACDLGQEDCPDQLLGQADRVFILIGQVGADYTIEKSILTKLAHQLSTGRQQVFYFSSVLVYGQTNEPADERAVSQPIDDYAKFKLAAEQILRGQILPAQLTILRLANVYGSPRNRGFIGLLMKRLGDPNSSIELNDDGRQRRDFLFLDDLIEAILRIMDSPSERGITNIATGHSHPLIEVIETLQELVGRKINFTVKHNDMSRIEPHDSLVDNGRLQQVFGLDRFTSLEEGLAQTVKRYGTDAS